MNFFFSSRRRHTFFFQAEDGIRDRSPSRGLGDVYKRQEFPHSPWVEIGTFSPQHSPPMPEYSGFEYGQSQLMTVDAYGMSIPPPYTSMPLPMPTHSWPSLLTTHSAFAASGIPVSTTPTSVSPSTPLPQVRKTSTGGSTPRRTLTDDDRRQMCIYHEENKTAKQTDIGGKHISLSALRG